MHAECTLLGVRAPYGRSKNHELPAYLMLAQGFLIHAKRIVRPCFQAIFVKIDCGQRKNSGLFG